MTNHSWLLEVFDDIDAYSQRYGLTSVSDAILTVREVAISEISDLEEASDQSIISILQTIQHWKFH